MKNHAFVAIAFVCVSGWSINALGHGERGGGGGGGFGGGHSDGGDAEFRGGGGEFRNANEFGEDGGERRGNGMDRERSESQSRFNEHAFERSNEERESFDKSQMSGRAGREFSRGNGEGNQFGWSGERSGKGRASETFGNGRPTTGQLDDFLGIRNAGNNIHGQPGHRSIGDENASRGAAEKFLHEHPTAFGSHAGEIAEGHHQDLPANGERSLRAHHNEPGPGQHAHASKWEDHHANRIPDNHQWNNWRHDHHDNVAKYWHSHAHDYDHWYNHDWWHHYHIPYPYSVSFNYWGWAAWPSLCGWVDYGWDQPVYYNYGDNVYYEGDQVYYGSQPVATAEQYAQQAAAIAATIPTAAPAPSDWMSLGVFAMTTDGKPTNVEPTQYLQLAVSKEGVINGTLQNTTSGTVQPVEGMVDKKSQRAAWTVKGKSWPVMETGIGNLTQDSAPALVHFADGSTKQWLLVRLDKPQQGDAQEVPPTN